MNLDEEIEGIISSFFTKSKIINAQESIYEKLANRFYWVGSKINWSKTKKHNYQSLDGNYNNWLIKINLFINKFGVDKEILNNNIYYVNDSSLDFAVSVHPEEFFSFLEMAITNIPQHHYFFDEEVKWCLVVSAEGYVDFGFSE